MDKSSEQDDVEPFSFRMAGIQLDDLISKDFLEDLRQAFPTASVSHMVIDLTGSENTIYIGKNTSEKVGKPEDAKLDVSASVPQDAKKTVELLLRRKVKQ